MHDRRRSVLFNPRRRGDGGSMMFGTLVSVAVAAAMVPISLRMAMLAADVTDEAEGVQAASYRAQTRIAASMAAVDPVGECASPLTPRRDECFRNRRVAGVAFVSDPSGGNGVCWQVFATTEDGATVDAARELRCLTLGPHLDEVLDDKVVFLEDSGVMSGVDAGGGGSLTLTAWTRAAPTTTAPTTTTTTTTTAPPTTTAPTTGSADEDLYLYLVNEAEWVRDHESDQWLHDDVEWVCVRWRPAAAGASWQGLCPCPDDPYERWPLPWSLATISEYGVKDPEDASSVAGTTALPLAWSTADPFGIDGERRRGPSGDLPDCAGRPSAQCAHRAVGAVKPAWSVKPDEIASRPPLLQHPAGLQSDECMCDMWWDPRREPAPQNTADCDATAVEVARKLISVPAAEYAGEGIPARINARAAEAEFALCVALPRNDRLDGEGHCSVTRIRASLR